MKSCGHASVFYGIKMIPLTFYISNGIVDGAYMYRVMIRDMVLNATLNNISVILWRSVLLMEKTGVPGGNHRPAAGH